MQYAGIFKFCKDLNRTKTTACGKSTEMAATATLKGVETRKLIPTKAAVNIIQISHRMENIIYWNRNLLVFFKAPSTVQDGAK